MFCVFVLFCFCVGLGGPLEAQIKCCLLLLDVMTDALVIIDEAHRANIRCRGLHHFDHMQGACNLDMLSIESM